MTKPIPSGQSKCVLDGESHYVRKNGDTYCGKTISTETTHTRIIDMVTCNKCINIFISKGII